MVDGAIRRSILFSEKRWPGVGTDEIQCWTNRPSAGVEWILFGRPWDRTLSRNVSGLNGRKAFDITFVMFGVARSGPGIGLALASVKVVPWLPVRVSVELKRFR